MKNNNQITQAIKKLFTFYLTIGAGICILLLGLSFYVPNINNLVPYLLFILSLSLNYLFVKDCLVVQEKEQMKNRDLKETESQ